MQKNILITVSKDAMRRNILETDFMDKVLSDEEVHVFLVVDQDKVGEYEAQFTHERISTVGFVRSPFRGAGKIVDYLLRTGINSHSLRTYRNRAYKRGEASFGSHLGKVLISNTLGRSRMFTSLLRSWYLKLPVPSQVNDIFEQCKPTLVFSLSSIDREFDSEFCKVAKQKGIRLVGMVRSWDNLNNHGILAVVPDLFLLQNKFLVEAAEKYQYIPMQNVPHELTGLPHYDLYFDVSAFLMPKEEFFKGMGLDPNKRLILLGGSDFYYSEDTLPGKLNTLIEEGKVPQDVQVLFRPHPSSGFKLAEYRLDELKHVVLNDAFSGGKKFSDTDVFINILHYSDIIINIASTLSIDAAVFDTPAICINFDDKEKNLSYWEEVGRLYDTFDHYEKLVATGGAHIATSVDDLAQAITRYLEDPSVDKEGRQTIIDTFVYKRDGKAAERIGDCIQKELGASA